MLKISSFIEKVFKNKIFRYLMTLNVGFKAGNLYLIAKKK
jgi:hypothetical protein